jgi:23S rRNA (adenine2503-C2)-methyltransferase
MMTMESSPNLFGMDRPALERLVGALGEPAYRAAQIYSWLYRRRARSLDEMTDLSRALRDALGAGHALRWPDVGERARAPPGPNP